MKKCVSEKFSRLTIPPRNKVARVTDDVLVVNRRQTGVAESFVDREFDLRFFRHRFGNQIRLRQRGYTFRRDEQCAKIIDLAIRNAVTLLQTLDGLVAPVG